MSYRDEKVEETKPHDARSTLARRPLKTFLRGPGYEFRVLEWDRGHGKNSERKPTLVSYREADERTYWRRVDGPDDWFEIIPERTEKNAKRLEGQP